MTNTVGQVLGNIDLIKVNVAVDEAIVRWISRFCKLSAIWPEDRSGAATAAEQKAVLLGAGLAFTVEAGTLGGEGLVGAEDIYGTLYSVQAAGSDLVGLGKDRIGFRGMVARILSVGWPGGDMDLLALRVGVILQ